MTLSIEALTSSLSSGLMAFPVTPFRDDFSFDEAAYRKLYTGMAKGGAAAMFVAGGAGELFSLTPAEHRDVVRASVAEKTPLPVIAGVGGSVEIAVEMARAAELEGADGLLLCPPYLVGGEQEGLAAYVSRVCSSVGIGVVIYNRDLLQVTAQTLSGLAGRHPNLVGLKDGVGNTEALLGLQAAVGDRLLFINGMPTAEIAALPYRALGVTTYSSAVYCFAPGLAMSFHDAFRAGDDAKARALLRDFYLPLTEIRRKGRGYAVSLVKAGLSIVGRPAGPVRPPLIDLRENERQDLCALLAAHAAADFEPASGQVEHA
jgi:5-dehydro-4-deoxyglucarate dehydratase